VRFVASTIDLAILLAVWFVAVLLLVVCLSATGVLQMPSAVAFDPATFAASDQGSALAIASGAILIAFSGYYHVYAWWRMGATPGHRLLDLRVEDFETGAPLTLRQSVARWLARDLPPAALLLDVLILVWYIGVAMSIARSVNGRGIHDLVARSVVKAGASGAAKEADR
jgi:uncharacterized RDD family membrane protein YckC